MRRRRSNRISRPSLLLTMAQLTAASQETAFRRSLLMARGACSVAEYQRMAAEKVAAMQTGPRALMRGKGPAAVLAPFATRAQSNAKRLRRKT